MLNNKNYFILIKNHLSSYDSISDFDDYINHYIYLFLLGGTLVLNELHFDSNEQRQLNELLFKGSSESPVPKIVGLADFLTSAIPIISSSFELLFDRYSKIPNLTKSVDVIMRRHNDNTGSSSISAKGESRLSSRNCNMEIPLYIFPESLERNSSIKSNVPIALGQEHYDKFKLFSMVDIIKFKDVIESYWSDIGTNYHNFKSINPMIWIIFPGVLITAFCDSDDNR
ncbi:hypothetical protein H8356DRAFT_1343995 [Neocallimastix lanati (nom. inval.)]|nr:hypothetical protein H8356DRAFT_1343995 [Neocallimastix sp. JGI-2020a]